MIGINLFSQYAQFFLSGGFGLSHIRGFKDSKSGILLHLFKTHLRMEALNLHSFRSLIKSHDRKVGDNLIGTRAFGKSRCFACPGTV